MLVVQARSVDVEVDEITESCDLVEFGCPAITTSTQTFSDSESAADLGPFDATAQVPGFSAVATQISTLRERSISASGSTFLDPGGQFIPGGPPAFISTRILETHRGKSSFSTTFDVVEPRPFRLVGEVRLDDSDSAIENTTSHIALTGPGAELIAQVAVISDPLCYQTGECALAGSVDASGVLAPGTYTLEAMTDVVTSSQASCSGVCVVGLPAEAHFDLVLDLPDPIPTPFWIHPLVVAGLLAGARRGARRAG